MARRYGVRPSEVIGIEDPLAAVQVDVGIALRGYQAESEARKESDGTNEISAEDLYAQRRRLG